MSRTIGRGRDRHGRRMLEAAAVALLKHRREAAAGRLGYSVEHLRKDREPLLLEAVADELYAMDSAYRLRHRHRTQAERPAPDSRLEIDWYEQHCRYGRTWTPVVALRADLLVLVDWLMTLVTWPGWPGAVLGSSHMSESISISEAKTQLSKLVARAERGEEVTIRRGNKPVARLVAIGPSPSSARSPIGVLRGQIWISDDADELGPEWDPYV